VRVEAVHSTVVVDVKGLGRAVYVLQFLAMQRHLGIRANCVDYLLRAGSLTEALQAIQWVYKLPYPDDERVISEIKPDLTYKSEVTAADSNLFAQVADCIMQGGWILFIGGDEDKGKYERWDFDGVGMIVEPGEFTPKGAFRPSRIFIP